MDTQEPKRKRGRPPGSKNQKNKKAKAALKNPKISGADLQELTQDLCIVRALLMTAATLLTHTLEG